MSALKQSQSQGNLRFSSMRKNEAPHTQETQNIDTLIKLMPKVWRNMKNQLNFKTFSSGRNFNFKVTKIFNTKFAIVIQDSTLSISLYLINIGRVLV